MLSPGQNICPAGTIDRKRPSFSFSESSPEVAWFCVLEPWTLGQKLQNVPTFSCSVRCRGPIPTSSYRKLNLMNLCHFGSPQLLHTFTRFLHFGLVFPRWLENLPFPRLGKEPIWRLESIVCVTLVINHFRLMNLAAPLRLLQQWPLYEGVFSFGCFSLWRECRPWSNRLTSADSPPHFLLAEMKLATLLIFPLPARLLHTSTWCHLQGKAAVTIKNSNM